MALSRGAPNAKLLESTSSLVVRGPKEIRAAAVNPAPTLQG